MGNKLSKVRTKRLCPKNHFLNTSVYIVNHMDVGHHSFHIPHIVQHKYCTLTMSILPLLSLLKSNPAFLSHTAKVKNGNASGHLHPSRLFHDGWPTMHQDYVRLEMALWSTLDAREALMAIWKMCTVHL